MAGKFKLLGGSRGGLVEARELSGRCHSLTSALRGQSVKTFAGPYNKGSALNHSDKPRTGCINLEITVLRHQGPPSGLSWVVCLSEYRNLSASIHLLGERERERVRLQSNHYKGRSLVHTSQHCLL